MYSKKTLKFIITSQNDNFINTDNDILTITNCKSFVEINAGTIAAGGQAEITLFGLSSEVMAILSAKGVWAFTDSKINYHIEVVADDSLIFSGYVYACFGDMNQQPEATLTILANGAGKLQKSNAPDFSAKGSIPVRDVLSGICQNSGYRFVDLGVDGVIIDPHYSGDSLRQLSSVCLTANLMYAIEKDVVSAWKLNKPSELPEYVPFVSPKSGLVGYPVYLPSGLSIQSTFSPLFFLGGSLELETSLPNTSGHYKIRGLKHSLSSWDVRGDWYTSMLLVPYEDTLNKMRNKEGGNA
ncbi:hypothetical protein AB7W40_09960 [Providencia rettgeri]